MPAKRFIITGSVQGVFFRSETQSKAKDLNLNGWVKNCDDGSVEIHAEGLEESLQKLEEWCHHGPSAAQVEGVESKEVEEQGCASFDIEY